MFFSLPDDIILEIFSCWLEFRELIHFDSAGCSPNIRKNLVVQYVNLDIVLPDDHKRPLSLYKWILKRNIKLRNWILEDLMQWDKNYFENLVSFNYVTHLRMAMSNITPPSHFSNVVNKCIHLKSIELVGCSYISHIDGEIMNQLETLCVENTSEENVVVQESLVYIKNHCTHLKVFKFNENNITLSQSLLNDIIFNNAATLTRIELSDAPTILPIVANHCKKCECLTINSVNITAEEILLLLRNCSKLKKFCLSNNNSSFNYQIADKMYGNFLAISEYESSDLSQLLNNFNNINMLLLSDVLSTYPLQFFANNYTSLKCILLTDCLWINCEALIDILTNSEKLLAFELSYSYNPNIPLTNDDIVEAFKLSNCSIEELTIVYYALSITTIMEVVTACPNMTWCSFDILIDDFNQIKPLEEFITSFVNGHGRPLYYCRVMFNVSYSDSYVLSYEQGTLKYL